MTASYILQQTYKINHPADHDMDVSVMGAKDTSQSALDSAFEGVKSGLSQCYDRTSVPGVRVRKFETDQVIDCGDKFGSGEAFLSDHDFSDGHYLWVTGCRDPRSNNTGGWEKRTQGFVSTSVYGEGYYLSSMAIHETLHAFLINNCVNTPGNDHVNGQDKRFTERNQFGDIVLKYRVTPMATSYEDTDKNYEARGGCNNDEHTDGTTNQLSDCTIQNIEDSRQHAMDF